MNVKSGRHIEIEQRTNGRRVWSAEDVEPQLEWDSFAFASEEIIPGAAELVVSVGLTHDPLPMVKQYVERSGILPYTTLSALPSAGPGSASVRSGSHAVKLAEQLIRKIDRISSTDRI